MLSGRAIAGEREKVESDSERERVRKRAKRKKMVAVIAMTVLILVVILLGALVVKEIMKGLDQGANVETKKEYAATIDVYDENGYGEISGGMREYIGKVEQDLRDLGYSAMRAVIPAGTVREVDFYVEGFDGYIKTNIDRDAAETAEDAGRMMEYLKNKGIKVTYVDVRVEGKGFYK